MGYDLVWFTECDPFPSCVEDDAFAPNHTIATAVAMGWDTALSGVTCGAQDDYFLLPEMPGCTGTATLTFEHDDGDLDLYLETLDGEIDDSSTSETDSENVSTTFTDNVIIRIHGYNSASNDYRLVTTYDCAP